MAKPNPGVPTGYKSWDHYIQQMTDADPSSALESLATLSDPQLKKFHQLVHKKDPTAIVPLRKFMSGMAKARAELAPVPVAAAIPTVEALAAPIESVPVTVEGLAGQEAARRSLTKSHGGATLGSRDMEQLSRVWTEAEPIHPSGDIYTGQKRKQTTPPPPDRTTGGGRTAAESSKFLTRARRTALVGQLEKKLPMAVAKRIGGGALKAIPVVGGALTARWLAGEAWDRTLGKDQNDKLMDAEFGLSLGEDDSWVQSAQDQSLAQLLGAGADISKTVERGQRDNQINREREMQQALAPWRAQMASQAYIEPPSLPEMLAKMGIDPYMGK